MQKENWRILREIQEHLGIRIGEVLDFYHAMEHVSKALTKYRGSGPRATREIKKYRKVLREEPNGFQQVIQALGYRARRSRGSAQAEIKGVLGYIYMRSNADRMRYHKYWNAGRPIGSGVQEAACKTLVTQRLKQSGMSWRRRGGPGRPDASRAFASGGAE